MTVTLERERFAVDRKAFPEAHGDIRKALLARGHVMFMGPSEERSPRVETLRRALELAGTAGMDAAVVRRLGNLAMEIRVDAFSNNG